MEELKNRKIPINKIQIDPKRMFSPRAKVESFLAQNQELKLSAQRAFVAYVKSVVLMKNKQIFKVDELETDAYAKSLGLVVPPRIRFLQRMQKNKEKNREKQTGAKKDDESDESGDSENEASGSDEESAEKNIKPTTSKSVSKDDDIDFNAALSSSDDEEEEDNFMRIKRRDHEISEENFPEVPSLEEIKSKSKQSTKPVTKAALAKKLIKKKIQSNKKVQFDEDGAEVAADNTLKSELAKDYEKSAEGGIDIEMAKQLIQEEDKFDKERFKSLAKARRKEKKKKLNDAGEQDDFGSDEENDGPDLSWLPDPDNLRANGNGDASDSESDAGYAGRQVVNSSDESLDDSVAPAPKLKRKSKKQEPSESEDSDDEEEDESSLQPPTKKIRKITSKLSVNEAEQFAMQLLKG